MNVRLTLALWGETELLVPVVRPPVQELASFDAEDASVTVEEQSGVIGQQGALELGFVEVVHCRDGDSFGHRVCLFDIYGQKKILVGRVSSQKMKPPTTRTLTSRSVFNYIFGIDPKNKIIIINLHDHLMILNFNQKNKKKSSEV